MMSSVQLSCTLFKWNSPLIQQLTSKGGDGEDGETRVGVRQR